MPSTTFIPGTVVTSTWLNEINDLALDGIKPIIFYSGSYSTLQAALTAAAGKVLVISQDYNLGSTPITVPAGTTVFAHGTTLTWTTNLTGITFTGHATLQSKWFGGTLVGPYSGTYNINGIAMYAFGTDNSPAGAPVFVQGPVIEGVTIKNWAYGGIYYGYTENGIAIHNHVYNCGYLGIAGLSARYNTFDYNIVHDIDGTGAPDRYGLFYSAAESSEISNPRAKNSTMSNNIVYNVPQWEGIDIHGDTDIMINNNNIWNCRFPIMVTRGDIAGNSTRAPKRVTVTNNNIVGKTNGAAITVTGANGYENAINIVIDGNTIENGGWDNDTSEGCIRVYNADNVQISNNILRNPYVWGIHLVTEVYGAHVFGNTIIDPNDSTYATPAGIYVGSNNVEAAIHGNYFIYQSSGTNTYVAVNSIKILNGLTGLELSIGDQYFNGIDATHLTVVLGTTTGVISRGISSEQGGAALAAGVKTVTFNKRFPYVPQVYISLTTAFNPIKVTSVTATDFSVAGTGTDQFYWKAEC